MTEKSEIILSSSELFLTELASAVDGLVYISETDASIDRFVGVTANSVTVDEVIRQTGVASDEPITAQSPDALFSQLTRIQDWYGEAEKARSAKFVTMVELLRANLTDLTEFRIGTSRINIYVVGLTADGRLGGIKTMAVET